eukprot:GILK01006102.1.p1 GENE.GILK01006102.1~~GILK01006102.1.p1  ORF type:complete len:398 (-),score=57.64 GILK01006102.1:83-1144(-)
MYSSLRMLMSLLSGRWSTPAMTASLAGVKSRPLFDPPKDMHNRMSELVKELQEDIFAMLRKYEPNHWQELKDEREGLYKCSRYMQDGDVFEKAAVNVTNTKRPISAGMFQKRSNDGVRFSSTNPSDYMLLTASISLIFHPHNPFAPTVHANYRYFETVNIKTAAVEDWYFGGGSDLTPSYVLDEDGVYFHTVLKNALDPIDSTLYSDWKRRADEYFRIPHRGVAGSGECRGIGGVFYNQYDDRDPETMYQIQRALGKSLNDAYFPILAKRKDTPYTAEHKQWQGLRHGRYVEFNVMYDEGTKYGLIHAPQTAESILVSLPLTARYEAHHKPVPGSHEEKSFNIFCRPKESWID